MRLIVVGLSLLLPRNERLPVHFHNDGYVRHEPVAFLSHDTEKSPCVSLVYIIQHPTSAPLFDYFFWLMAPCSLNKTCIIKEAHLVSTS